MTAFVEFTIMQPALSIDTDGRDWNSGYTCMLILIQPKYYVISLGASHSFQSGLTSFQHRERSCLLASAVQQDVEKACDRRFAEKR